MEIIDPISEKIGTGIENIRIFKNFIDEDDRLKILDNCYDYTKNTHGEIYYPIPKSDSIRDIYIKYSKKMYENISIFYKDKSEIFVPKMITREPSNLLAHPVGSYMIPHVDIVGYTQELNYNLEDYINKWSGHLSSVIYLNDNYDGGELYFPDHNIEIKPEAGDYITWPGNKWYQHGVKTVKGNVRYTLSIWARFLEAYKNEIYSSGSKK